MSWDSYIDNLAGQSKGSVDKCCIIALDGGAPWTTDAHAQAFKLSQEEKAAIARSLKSKDFTPFQAGGIYAEGTKYQFLRVDDSKVVVGKKKEFGSIVIHSTKQAVVIAHCREGAQAADTKTAVNVIAEYLESLGM